MKNDERHTVCEATASGAFVATTRGECLKISVPAQTHNEWANPNIFIDLPMMDEETFINFINTISKFKDLY